MELMKESRIWMLWKIFYCQMECKNQWLRGNFVRFETSWPGALQLFDKTEISSQSLLPSFFPFSAILQSVLGHLVPLWEGDRVSSHEARRFGKPARKKLCSALHRCTGESRDASATGLPIPNPTRREKLLYVTYCSGQLITGWKRRGTSYSPNDMICDCLTPLDKQVRWSRTGFPFVARCK